jgi:hypothetical protein
MGSLLCDLFTTTSDIQMNPSRSADAKNTIVIAELGRLMEEFFRAVSFEPGEKPPYREINEIFIASGLLIKNTGAAPEICSLRQFLEPREAMVRAGQLTRFREEELSATNDVFGNVAHRFSVYAKSGTLNGSPFSAQGMISTQFIKTPSGWKMSSMAWDDERPGLSVTAAPRADTAKA